MDKKRKGTFSIIAVFLVSIIVCVIVVGGIVTIGIVTLPPPPIDNTKQENHDLLDSYINPKTYTYSIAEVSQSAVTINNTFDSDIFDKNGNYVKYKSENSDYEAYVHGAVSKTMTHRWTKLRKSDAGDYSLTFKANISEHVRTLYDGIYNGEHYDVRQEFYTEAQETVITNIAPFSQFSLRSSENKDISHHHSDLNNCESNLSSVSVNSDGKFVTTKVVSSFDYIANRTTKAFVIERLELILLDDDEVMLMFYQYNIYPYSELDQNCYQKLLENGEL